MEIVLILKLEYGNMASKFENYVLLHKLLNGIWRKSYVVLLVKTGVRVRNWVTFVQKAD